MNKTILHTYSADFGNRLKTYLEGKKSFWWRNCWSLVWRNVLIHINVSGLLNHYGGGHHDYTDTNMALSKVRSIIKKLSTKLKESENLVKLMELQRDLVGYDNLVSSGREFVREGCLQKLSRKGYQQRMFFLVGILPPAQYFLDIFCIFQFSDMLLYANRAPGPGLQFRVHGQLSVADLQVTHERQDSIGSVMILIHKLGGRQRAEDGSRVLFQYLRWKEGADGGGGLE